MGSAVDDPILQQAVRVVGLQLAGVALLDVLGEHRVSHDGSQLYIALDRIGAVAVHPTGGGPMVVHDVSAELNNEWGQKRIWRVAEVEPGVVLVTAASTGFAVRLDVATGVSTRVGNPDALISGTPRIAHSPVTGVALLGVWLSPNLMSKLDLSDPAFPLVGFSRDLEHTTEMALPPSGAPLYLGSGQIVDVTDLTATAHIWGFEVQGALTQPFFVGHQLHSYVGPDRLRSYDMDTYFVHEERVINCCEEDTTFAEIEPIKGGSTLVILRERSLCFARGFDG